MRLRNSSAPHEDEIQISRHLDRAVRELEMAMDLVRRDRNAEREKSRSLHRDIQRAILAVSSVERVPKRFFEDPDRSTEDELAQRSRERRLLKKAQTSEKVSNSDEG